VKVSFEGGGAPDRRGDAHSEAERERPSCLQLPVRVSGGVFGSYRASLVETGLWDSVRLGFAARLDVDPEAVEQIDPQAWLDVASLQALLGAISERFELDAIRTSMRHYIAAPQSGSVYAPMLRSWSRSFEQSPMHMLRGLMPLWRAALRHAEPPAIVPKGRTEVHVLLQGASARMLRDSPALTASFEGVLLGLLDLVRPSPVLAEVETRLSADGVCSACRF
jgi:hypothetical protein